MKTTFDMKMASPSWEIMMREVNDFLTLLHTEINEETLSKIKLQAKHIKESADFFVELSEVIGK